MTSSSAVCWQPDECAVLSNLVCLRHNLLVPCYPVTSAPVAVTLLSPSQEVGVFSASHSHGPQLSVLPLQGFVCAFPPFCSHRLALNEIFCLLLSLRFGSSCDLSFWYFSILISQSFATKIMFLKGGSKYIKTFHD